MIGDQGAGPKQTGFCECLILQGRAFQYSRTALIGVSGKDVDVFMVSDKTPFRAELSIINRDAPPPQWAILFGLAPQAFS